MARYDQSQEAREVRQAPLDGGINDQSEETLLPPNISPFAQNVEFNRGNVETTRGAVKFNNQVAPGAALLTKCDPGLSPIPP